MSTLFLVRQYLCLDEKDEIRIDEEYFFHTKKDAARKLRQLYDLNEAEETYAVFRNELTEIQLGESGYYTTKIFSMKGECLEFRKHDHKGYKTRFFKKPIGLSPINGQVVKLYSNIESGYSRFVNTKLAVILPWKALKNELTFGFINNAGYFNHFHSEEPLVKSVCETNNGYEFKVLQAVYQAEIRSKTDEISSEFQKFLSGKLSILELCHSGCLNKTNPNINSKT